MNSTFEKILSLTLLHDYYTGGQTPDFSIVPTAETSRLLKNNSWIFKRTAQGFFISCDNLAMARLPQLLTQRNLRLSFAMKLKNKSFLNITALPQRSGGKDIYYLHSQPGSQDLLMATLNCYPPVFTYKFTAAGYTTSLQAEDPNGNIIIEESFEGVAGQPLSASVNLTGHTPGLYRFMAEGQDDENIYITNESPGGFGILEISLPVDFNPQTSSAYQFQFNARASVWEYHLLLGKDYTGYSFAIDDTVEGHIFTETIAPPDYDQGSSSVFASQNPIAYREAPKKGLQLVITAGDGTISTHNHLPGPAVAGPESKVYLTI